MAFLAARNKNTGGEGNRNFLLPTVAKQFINYSETFDEPIAETELSIDNFDKSIHNRTKIIGDVRAVNLAYTRLRIAEL